jgi:hypothetical protein
VSKEATFRDIFTNKNFCANSFSSFTPYVRAIVTQLASGMIRPKNAIRQDKEIDRGEPKSGGLAGHRYNNMLSQLFFAVDSIG